MPINRKKLIVILGPTASGKSTLAVKLAKFINGEIVSADSRQVYKGLNIGTGKITKKEMMDVPHHLLDVASPKRKFTVAQYKNLAFKAINKIYRKNKIPILVGGTGFYIQAIVDNLTIPPIPPDWSLRKKLAQKSTPELYKILKKLDPRRAKKIDKNNPRRLIRAIEIVKKSKKAIPPLKKNPLFDILIVGIKKSPTELKKLIRKRLLKRLKQGMIAEVKKLKKIDLSWQRLDELGLEYRYCAKYLQNKISRSDLIKTLEMEIKNYSRRQMTWFRRHLVPDQVCHGTNKKINWIKTFSQVKKLVKNFLRS